MRPAAVTRRQALAELAAAAALILLGGCGGGESGAPGSTLISTWGDRGGTGTLAPGPGEPLLTRTDLGGAAAVTATLATLAHITDAHVLDAASPARVPFLDRLGPPFQSTFRPQETLTSQVLAGAVRAVRALRPDAVIQGGDVIDNVQSNELSLALAVLRGGRADPGSGPHGYDGVQSSANADPFYYRPAIDAPRHPTLLRDAVRPFAGPGLDCPCYPVLGDHDILVAGEIAPTAQTRALAVGNQALWELPPGLTMPSRTELPAVVSPDGPPDPGLVNAFLARALAGPKVHVPADPRRRELDASEVISRLASAAGTPLGDSDPSDIRPALDYHADVGRHVRLIVLDLARRGGGSGGQVRADQPPWLASELAAAANRWVIAVAHQPLAGAEGGDALLALLDAHPRVIATLAGHSHHNRIAPRATRAGGYWVIETASLIDYPQQARALRVLGTAGGGVAIQTWMVDHALPGALGGISRQLSYLDAQGGRPNGFAGHRLDRNVTLYRAPPEA